MLLCSLKYAREACVDEVFENMGKSGFTPTTKLLKIMEMEKFYVAPEVEVLEVSVEKGFEGSIELGGGGYEGL